MMDDDLSLAAGLEDDDGMRMARPQSTSSLLAGPAGSERPSATAALAASTSATTTATATLGGAGLASSSLSAAPTASSSPLASLSSAGTAQANPLTRKLNKILQGGDGLQRGGAVLNDDVVNALKSLSSSYAHNTKRARQHLRGDLERQALVVNDEFLQAFETVHQKLESVQKEISGMAACCKDMTSRLQSARADTSDLLLKTSALQTQRQHVQVRVDLLNAFLQRFQLSEAELSSLSSSKDLTMQFFSALGRVKAIHGECKVLLRSKNQQAGLAIMESMAALQEAAYERLYRWTQSICRGLGNDIPEHPILLCKAFDALRERPVLFQYSLSELGTARRNGVVRAFIDALTRGGPGGMPRPIELHSHDPLRYTSDMLAWLHQAVASERELLTLILSSRTDEQHMPQRNRRLATEQDSEQLQKTLDSIMEGACRPLKVRVEQVLVANPGLVICYRIASILQFYGRTIAELLVETGALPALLAELREFALKVFFDALNLHANSLLATVEPPPDDLRPPAALNNTLSILRDILSSQDTDVVATDVRQAELAKVLSSVLDPVMQMCALSASTLAPADMASYMVNCVYHIQSTLSLFEFTDDRVEMLEAQIEAHVDTLVHEQARFLLQRCGMTNVLREVQSWNALPADQREPLSRRQGMAPTVVRDALNSLDQFLTLADTSMIPQCDLLLSTRIRNLVRENAVKLFSHTYEDIYTAVNAPENGYPSLPFARITPPQIITLLS